MEKYKLVIEGIPGNISEELQTPQTIGNVTIELLE